MKYQIKYQCINVDNVIIKEGTYNVGNCTNGIIAQDKLKTMLKQRFKETKRVNFIGEPAIVKEAKNDDYKQTAFDMFDFLFKKKAH